MELSCSSLDHLCWRVLWMQWFIKLLEKSRIQIVFQLASPHPATHPNSWKYFIFCVCRIFTGFWHWSRISTHAKEQVTARGKLPPLTLYFTCSCYCCFWIHLKKENLLRSSRIAYILFFSVFMDTHWRGCVCSESSGLVKYTNFKVFVRLLSKLVERRRN